MTFKAGDRVRDKFKEPKPGDESNEGVVKSVDEDGTITVEWETGWKQENSYTVEQADGLLEKVEAPGDEEATP